MTRSHIDNYLDELNHYHMRATTLTILAQSEAHWRAVFDVFFGSIKPCVDSVIAHLFLPAIEYYDPDGSYEDDARAWFQAFTAKLEQINYLYRYDTNLKGM